MQKLCKKAGGIVYKRMISIAYSTYILTAQAHFGHFYTLCTKEWLNSAAKHHKHNDAEWCRMIVSETGQLASYNFSLLALDLIIIIIPSKTNENFSVSDKRVFLEFSWESTRSPFRESAGVAKCQAKDRTELKTFFGKRLFVSRSKQRQQQRQRGYEPYMKIKRGLVLFLTHTLCFTYSLSLFHILFLSLPHIFFLSLPHTHTHSHSLSLLHIYSFTLFSVHILSLSLYLFFSIFRWLIPLLLHRPRRHRVKHLLKCAASTTTTTTTAAGAEGAWAGGRDGPTIASDLFQTSFAHCRSSSSSYYN